MHTRRAVVLASVVLLTSLFTANATVASANEYRDPATRFAFQVPDGWQPMPSGTLSRTAGLTSPQGDAGFEVALASVRGEVTLTQVMPFVYMQFRQLQGYEADSASDVDATVAGVPAKLVSYRQRLNGDVQEFKTYVVLQRGTLFYLNFGTLNGGPATTFASAESTILGSWQFLA